MKTQGLLAAAAAAVLLPLGTIATNSTAIPEKMVASKHEGGPDMERLYKYGRTDLTNITTAEAINTTQIPTANDIGTPPTMEQIKLAIKALRDLMDGESFAQAQFLRWAIRMGFHDCFQSCDGYIDLNDSENFGLEPLVEAYESLMELKTTSAVRPANPVFGPSFGMSRADFFSLSFVVALQIGFENGVRDGRYKSEDYPDLPIAFGRVDADIFNPPDLSELPLPHAANGFDQIELMKQRLNMTDEEVTVLVGIGHSFGGASPTATGFKGAWTPNQQTLDNQYFTNLADPEAQLAKDAHGYGAWSQIVLANGQVQWGDRVTSGSTLWAETDRVEAAATLDGNFMLNTDMSLYYGIKPTTVQVGKTSFEGIDLSDCGPWGNNTSYKRGAHVASMPYPSLGRSALDACVKDEPAPSTREFVDKFRDKSSDKIPGGNGMQSFLEAIPQVVTKLNIENTVAHSTTAAPKLVKLSPQDARALLRKL